MILVIAEHGSGKLNPATWEAVAAAQQMSPGGPIVVGVPGAPGAELNEVVAELANAAVLEIVTIEHAFLEPYTPDGYTAALQEVVAQLSPSTVLLPHTYRTRDFAPKLAARQNCPLITDVTAVKTTGGRPVFVRPMFQGKLHADVVPDGPEPHIISIQVGAFRPEQAARGQSAAPLRALPIRMEGAAVREKSEPPFREARQ